MSSQSGRRDSMAKPKGVTTYRLPDLTYTDDKKLYMSAWAKFSTRFEKCFGGTVVAFDPGIRWDLDGDRISVSCSTAEHLMDRARKGRKTKEDSDVHQGNS